MSSLRAIEKRTLENVLGMGGGYVLDMSNDDFANLLAEYGISIYDDAYGQRGNSKANRLRAFWDDADDVLTAKVLSGLLEWCASTDATTADDEDNYKKALAIVARLGEGMPSAVVTTSGTEAFLHQQYADISFGQLGLDHDLVAVLEARLREAKFCVASAPLATVFLCGSILEGVLLGIAQSRPADFNSAGSAPKDVGGKVKAFSVWSLAQRIDVAHELGIIGLDVKRHGHALRDFRNYIHPRQQLDENFSPDTHTAQIAMQVLKAALADVAKSVHTCGHAEGNGQR